MNGYEQILTLMRQQGGKSNPSVPILAEMKSATTCAVGDLILDADDLLVAKHLKGDLQKDNVVLVQRLSDEKYAIIERLVEL